MPCCSHKLGLCGRPGCCRLPLPSVAQLQCAALPTPPRLARKVFRLRCRLCCRRVYGRRRARCSEQMSMSNVEVNVACWCALFAFLLIGRLLAHVLPYANHRQHCQQRAAIVQASVTVVSEPDCKLLRVLHARLL